ncbi:hypothetical protein FOL46_008070 [Perkinsus olseni]|uniref:Uncharacterized protein n=1 Tax=Perkinsus olseni TaxID=32597 RepID=A0A7J6L9R2_PEROL|nr:hypothetical protein FOL46_008070 [Perkinsus olseni]
MLAQQGGSMLSQIGKGGIRSIVSKSSQSGGVLCPHSVGKQKFGYIQVNKRNKYFYAVIEADIDPLTAPTFLYLAGGPGESSLIATMGFAGPCNLDSASDRPVLNEFSWTKRANSVWVDAPAPTGFSTGPVERTLNAAVANLIQFADEFFKKNEKLNKNVHLVGSSSSASVLAMLGARILKVSERKIDLKGLMMISGVVGPSALYRGCLEIAKERALLSKKNLDKMEANLEKCLKGISDCNELGPGRPPLGYHCWKATVTCESLLVDPIRKTGTSVYDLRVDDGSEEDLYAFELGDFEDFLNLESVQEHLDVSKWWYVENEEVFEVFGQYTTYDTTHFVTELLNKGMKVLVFNGDQDYVTNTLGTLKWLSSLEGTEKYGEKLQRVPIKNLEYGEGQLMGRLWASKYANGAELAFIEAMSTNGFSSRLRSPRQATALH